ncbi:hypothetical protein AB0A95_18435 [Micromonospora sp. NPDC049230]|uniref:hypothetical protein n=1 Tax=Micromonospora sp. NPDC049230 TaxID=3155502 RepID=UPI00340E3D3F
MSAESHPDVHWPPGWGPAANDTFVSHHRLIAAAAGTVFARLVAFTSRGCWSSDRAETPDRL